MLAPYAGLNCPTKSTAALLGGSPPACGFQESKMPYVLRGPDGKIDAIFQNPREGADEELQPDDPEVMAFLSVGLAENELEMRQARDRLAISDLEMVRVFEDVIEIMIDKGLILITDLPEAAQEKLMERHRLREKLVFLHQAPEGESDVI
jgi:hypothetical protein